jgi:membrane peptidoglycan carboxypeptidase
LLPKLDGTELSGTFGANGHVALDTRALEKTDLDFVLDQRCRVAKAPVSIDVAQFRRPFEMRVYDPKGNPRTATFGPGSAGWTPLESISPYVIDAVLTCEDGAFFSHAGFSYQAIRNALLANVKAGKFLLGASTVTMQLAKNLYLDRRKLASRKLQEAILTIWLEQALGKNGIIELYLNVIEFGPNLYGIGPASWHYFGRPPSELDPLEATFLISLLPAPVKKHSMYERGSVGPGYLAYLRTLLKIEHERGRLDDEELAGALEHDLTFHKDGDPPPPPHGKAKASADKERAPSDDAFDPSLVPPEE